MVYPSRLLWRGRVESKKLLRYKSIITSRTWLVTLNLFKNMKYKDYLNSPHWKQFRSSIYSTRKTCQKCSAKNKKLNIHHRHYRSLGNETGSDVIVLCQECHFRDHQKNRWTLAMKKGKDLDFVKIAKKTKKIYNISNVIEKCNRCGEEHGIFYKNYPTVKRLVMACPNSKPRITFLKFREDPNIPTL